MPKTASTNTPTKTRRPHTSRQKERTFGLRLPSSLSDHLTLRAKDRGISKHQLIYELLCRADKSVEVPPELVERVDRLAIRMKKGRETMTELILRHGLDKLERL